MALTAWFNGRELPSAEGAGRAEDTLPASLLSDRINAFGDGVFETMRLERGVIPLLDWHLARLRRSLAALDITVDEQLVQDDIDRARKKSLACEGPQVLKLLLSRGSSIQGYAAAESGSHRALFLLPLQRAAKHSGRAMICDFRLSSQPQLAGIKHCNRLDQVLARREVSAAEMDEGLLRDQAGNVVEAVSANLFVLQGDRLLTPPVVDCGVSGVMRAFLFDTIDALSDLRIVESPVDLSLLRTADAVLLSSATQGLRCLSSCRFPDGETVCWRENAVLSALQLAVEDRLTVR